MIPKTLHYIWLSEEGQSRIIKRCLASWKKAAPDFEIRCWRMKDFDWDRMPEWVKQAVELRKWAFACDYLRLWILYHEGGIYLDADVFMLKDPGEFLDTDFFSAVEYYRELCPDPGKYLDGEGRPKDGYVPGFGLQAAVMGSTAGHPFPAACMEFYETHPLIQEDGSLYSAALAPGIQAKAAEAFGFRYRDQEQYLTPRMMIYPHEYFAGGFSQLSSQSRMLHLCSGSWRDMSLFRRLKLDLYLLRGLRRL